mmetsp:Transcript_34009/g.68637  ORF Transcript_34009/g.68637 Transcript_34009/m.68637 type:complete len:206 (-) Transcript_34009:192-809(-)
MISAVKTLWPSRPTARATADALDILPPVTKIRSCFFGVVVWKLGPKTLWRSQAARAKSPSKGAHAQRKQIAAKVLARARMPSATDRPRGLAAAVAGACGAASAFSALRLLRPSGATSSLSFSADNNNGKDIEGMGTPGNQRSVICTTVVPFAALSESTAMRPLAASSWTICASNSADVELPRAWSKPSSRRRPLRCKRPSAKICR